MTRWGVTQLNTAPPLRLSLPWDLETVLGHLVPCCRWNEKSQIIGSRQGQCGRPVPNQGSQFLLCHDLGLGLQCLWNQFLYIEVYRFKEAQRLTTLPWLQSPGNFKRGANRSSVLKLLGLLAESTFCYALDLFFVYRFVFWLNISLKKINYQ